MVPRSIHEFSRCVAQIGLIDYVNQRQASARGDDLSAAVRAVFDAYVGPVGWLGRHASKAFNYLCVSTITGRNASVGGGATTASSEAGSLSDGSSTTPSAASSNVGSTGGGSTSTGSVRSWSTSGSGVTAKRAEAPKQ